MRVVIRQHLAEEPIFTRVTSERLKDEGKRLTDQRGFEIGPVARGKPPSRRDLGVQAKAAPTAT